MEKINKKLLNWASILDPGAREQAERAASMPFVFPHLALMPDAHLGRGATVGSVIPTDRAIIPAAVGVDIGCGMAAVRTQFTRDQLTARGPLAPLREAIEHAVPLSAGRYNTAVAATAAPRIAALTALAEEAGFDPARDASNWALQLGTLGGGNHFIEVTVDELDRVWLFLHSGSRGIGNKIAMRHIAVARAAMEQWWITLPDPDLAYLVEDTEEFWTCIRELRWAQHFALLNREEMMDRVVAATGAFVGTPGLIPGSMGTASYVVTGKGNAPSLHSSPHGAGRTHSRAKARKTFTHEQLREAMAGIEFRDSAEFLDEIPAAYKEIDVVMADAADLVEVRHTLRQVVNVKGA